MSEMKHIGIIGIGYQGRKLADIFSSQAEIVMCASRGNAERIAALKKRHPSIAVTNDYRDLLSDSKIEGVVIATPIDTHAAMASEALKAGKHVFVEKPLATDKKTARALVEEAGAHNLSIFTGYTFLYHPCFFELQRILRDRPIESLYASWYKCGSFNEDILWNLLVHDIAIVIALCGEPRKLTLEGTYRAITDADVAYVHLPEFEQGVEDHGHLIRVVGPVSAVPPLAVIVLDDLLVAGKSFGVVPAHVFLCHELGPKAERIPDRLAEDHPEYPVFKRDGRFHYDTCSAPDEAVQESLDPQSIPGLLDAFAPGLGNFAFLVHVSRHAAVSASKDSGITSPSFISSFWPVRAANLSALVRHSACSL